MTREAAVSHATDHVDSGRLQSELAHLVGYRSESQNPDRRDVLQDYLAQAILPRLTAAGFDCAIHDNPDGPAKGGPILLGTRIEDPSLPTILTYGHGDVIRAQTGAVAATACTPLHAGRTRATGCTAAAAADNKVPAPGQYRRARCHIAKPRQAGFQLPDRDRNRRGDRIAGSCRVL